MSDKKEMRKRIIKRLRPFTKSRFLLGEVPPALEKLDLVKFLEHRANLILAEPTIDNKPPKFQISLRYDVQKLNADAKRVREIDKENMELLKSLNTIARNGAKVECWNELRPKKKTLAESEEDKFRSRYLMRENRKILDYIENVKSHYSTKELLEDWKKMKARIVYQSK